jgi:DNA-binding XRE family transcriptional regulator
MTSAPTLGPDGLSRVWEIELFESDDGRKPVLDWIESYVTPTKRRALGSAMRRVLQTLGPAVARSGWGRPIGKGIFAFRLRMNGKQIINLEEARRRLKILQRRDATTRKAQRMGGTQQPSHDVPEHIEWVVCSSTWDGRSIQGNAMNDFDELIDEIEQEAVAEGPAAVAELRALDARFRLAAELLAARTSAHMSQKQLAVRSGVQQAEISKIERGEVIPKISTMDRLLAPLGRRLAVIEDHEPAVA